MAWSLMKARVRPSASWTRRRIISPEFSGFAPSRPLSLRIFAAGWPFGTSNTAVTWPCSTAATPRLRAAPAAEPQREGTGQDGFPRTGFAGQHRQATGKLDIEPFDQDDVTDRKTRQHGRSDPGGVVSEVVFFSTASLSSASSQDPVS